MKKILVVLTAAALLTGSLPGFALAHGGGHDPADTGCARDCELMLKNCSLDADTIQQTIKKLEAAINNEDGKPEKVADVRALQRKLDDAKETLNSLVRGGH